DRRTDIGVLATYLDVDGGPERKMAGREQSNAGTLVGRNGLELLGAARDLGVEPWRQFAALRSDECGPELNARPNPDAIVAIVLGRGSAPCRQESSRANQQQAIHPCGNRFRLGWLHVGVARIARALSAAWSAPRQSGRRLARRSSPSCRCGSPAAPAPRRGCRSR